MGVKYRKKKNQSNEIVLQIKTHTPYNKIFLNVKRKAAKYDMVWIKDFPHIKHCKLLHNTYKHFQK